MELLHRHKRAFLISGILICIVAIILTVSPATGPTIVERGLSFIVVPLQRGTSVSISWVQRQFSGFTNNQRLITENVELRRENDRLLAENVRMQRASEENAELMQLLNMQQRYAEFPTMGARVIGRDPNDWNRGFHIDRGSSHGLEVNMPVLGGGALIGIVREALPGSSYVVSITDRRFSVAVISERTGDIGIVGGTPELMQQGLARMNHIDAAAQIIPGDRLTTSPHSSIFPPGLLVGTVISVHPNPDGLTQFAIVEPAATLNAEMVLVIAETFAASNIVRDEPNFEMTE